VTGFLVHGGAGGVGHVAVQLATSAGAKVVATAGSEGARDRVESLGAVRALDYASDSLAAEIRTTTDEAGLDVVLDHMLGKRPERQSVLERVARLLQRGELTAEVAAVYDLDEIRQAHRAVVEGGHVGKVIVTP